MTTLTKEDEQLLHIKAFLSFATVRDFDFVVRLIHKDLHIFTGAKFVLNALHPSAFEAYRNTSNLKSIIDKVLKNQLNIISNLDEDVEPKLTKELSVGLQLMIPIKPMLASACKSFERAWEKCPNGMYAEIKYDGERVQTVCFSVFFACF